MKISLLYIFLILILFCSCKATKEARPAENLITKLYEIPPTLSASNQFRAFWSDLKQESDGFEINNFQPSEKLIKNYNLRLQNNEYYFSGFLTTNNEFEKNVFNNLGGNLVTYTSDKHSFSFPLKNITELVNLKGIERIELSLSTHKINFNEN